MKKENDKFTDKEKKQLIHQLGERVKELNCLYGISHLIEKDNTSLEDILNSTCNIIKESWQFPDDTCVRIVVDGNKYKTSNFKTTKWKQVAQIKSKKESFGQIEVYYLKSKPKSDEGPFLKEERNLIEAVAERLGKIIIRYRTEEELRAYNQQLQASDQQFKASNQQLQASEQQLKASNQQLQASGQQLKSSNQQLQASEENYRSTIDDLPVGVVVHNSDSSILLSNPESSKILGLSAEQMMGKEAIDPSWCFVHEDSTKMKIEDYPVSKVISTKKPIYEYNVGIKVPKRDGITWVIVNAIPIFTSNNELDRIIINFIDITKRKRAEEELKDSKSKSHAWLENSPVCTKVLDLDFNLQYMSKAGVDALKIDDVTTLYGNPYPFDFYPDSFKIPMTANLNKAKETGKTITQEAFVTDVEGNKLWYHSTILPINDDKGQLDYIMVLSVETTDRKRAEEKLQASEDKYRLLVDNSTASIILFDIEGNILFMNKASIKMTFGDESASYDGLSLYDIAPNREKADFLLERHRKIKESGKGDEFEDEIVTPDGAHWYRSSIQPATNANNEVIGIQVVSNNITERKRAEKALEKQQYYLTKAQEIGSIGTWELDLIKNVLIWTDENYRIFGVPLGTELNYEIFLEQIHPDDREYVNKEWMAATKGKPYDIEHRLIVDGKVRWVREKADVIFDDNGKAISAIGFTQNITKFKVAEAALNKSNSRYKLLFDNLDSGINLLDKDGNFLLVNEVSANTWGKKPEDLINKNVKDVFPPEFAKKALDTIQKVKEKGVGFKREQFIKYLNKHFVENVQPVFNDQNEFSGVQVVTVDITETKRLQELESRAERLEMAGTIAGQVAHDFNNLLAPIVAYPDFIRDEIAFDNKSHTYLNSIEAAGLKIASINQDLLAMGRRGHYTMEVLDLNQIVIQTAMEIESRTRTIALEKVLCDDLMKIKGGNAQIHRMLTNLLVNAQDAMADIGQISIRTENYYADDTAIAFGRVPKGEYVKLTVSDNGCGIPDDIINSILDPFFSTKSADKKRGSGLGLSVVDAVMKDHNGYLDLSSKIGQGTSFYAYFPVSREYIESEKSEKILAGTEKILVIDDDSVQREVTTRVLMKQGYKLSSVESGEKAVEFIRENPQDLIVLDMVMPGGIDGAETYRQIIEIYPNQKAIIVSGFSESERVLEAQKMGAGAFIKKPVTKNIIATAVRTELDRPQKTLQS
ncbi:MAG: PAS domain S-box protein [candidate division Zixibacteria bacterium]|nr:PAS domain S-box protein [candidate division Zixibacteria bacterium]